MFDIIEADTTRESLIKLERDTFCGDNPESKSDTELLLRIIVQLRNDLEEQKSHSHSIR